MHRFISGLSILFHWSMCLFLCKSDLLMFTQEDKGKIRSFNLTYHVGNWFWWLLFKLYCKIKYQFSSIQSLSRVRLFATPWIAARQASLSITNFWSSLRLMSIESVMPSSHLILCRPLLLKYIAFIHVNSNYSVTFLPIKLASISVW